MIDQSEVKRLCCPLFTIVSANLYGFVSWQRWLAEVVHNSYGTDSETSAEEETALWCPRAIHLWTIIDTRLISEALLRLVGRWTRQTENSAVLCINQTFFFFVVFWWPILFEESQFSSTNHPCVVQSTCSLLAERILGWVGWGWGTRVVESWKCVVWYCGGEEWSQYKTRVIHLNYVRTISNSPVAQHEF